MSSLLSLLFLRLHDCDLVEVDAVSVVCEAAWQVVKWHGLHAQSVSREGGQVACERLGVAIHLREEGDARSNRSGSTTCRRRGLQSFSQRRCQRIMELGKINLQGEKHTHKRK